MPLLNHTHHPPEYHQARENPGKVKMVAKTSPTESCLSLQFNTSWVSHLCSEYGVHQLLLVDEHLALLTQVSLWGS